MAKLADLRRVERLILLARRLGVTRLSVTQEGIELELGAVPPPGQARQGNPRARLDPRDTRSVDEYLRHRFGRSDEGN